MTHNVKTPIVRITLITQIVQDGFRNPRNVRNPMKAVLGNLCQTE